MLSFLNNAILYGGINNDQKWFERWNFFIVVGWERKCVPSLQHGPSSLPPTPHPHFFFSGGGDLLCFKRCSSCKNKNKCFDLKWTALACEVYVPVWLEEEDTDLVDLVQIFCMWRQRWRVNKHCVCEHHLKLKDNYIVRFEPEFRF